MLDINSLQPLPDFSWTETELRPEVKNYLEYYGINFSERADFACKHHFGVKKLYEYSIAVHYFELDQSKGSIVLIHGYMDHTGLYNHVIEVLLQSGYNVLAYDLPGHGLSSGEQAGIPSFADYQKVLSGLMEEAKENLPKPWHVVAQSTGGAIAMDFLMSNPAHGFSKAILLAPLVIPKRWAYIKFQLFMIGWVLRSVPREFVKNSNDEEFLYFLKYQDSMQTKKIAGSWVKALFFWQKHFSQCTPCEIPLLVIQGDADFTIDWQYNLKRIAEKFPKYKEVLVEGARHHLVKESDILRKKIFTELLRFLDR